MSSPNPQPNKVIKVSPETPINIAKNLRQHKELKQRKGLLQGSPVDFFRYKRFSRALHSPEYAKLSKKNPELYPEITREDDAKACFILLIKSQLVYPVTKLHHNELKEHGLAPNKDFPHLVITNKATLQPDEYYVWNYNKKSITFYLSAIGIVLGILALVCYPLWPLKMRIGVYYLSYAALGLIIVFFGVALVRLVLYVVTLPVFSSKGGFWIFPNLFEDCGVLESFKPFYGFGDKECYTVIKKLNKKQKKLKNKLKNSAKESEAAAAATTTTATSDSPIKRIEEIPE